MTQGDVAKATTARKRHLAVDTLAVPIKCQITAASLQDRDALAPLPEGGKVIMFSRR
jgi:hypothetical protein